VLVSSPLFGPGPVEQGAGGAERGAGGRRCWREVIEFLHQFCTTARKCDCHAREERRISGNVLK